MALAAGAVLLSGCASPVMEPVSDEPVATDGMSTITFYRDNTFKSRHLVPVLEGTPDGQVSPIALLRNNQKVRWRTTPGEHYFSVNARHQRLLKADLKANKHYYAAVGPKAGGFRLLPKTADDLADPACRERIKACETVSLNAKGNKWFHRRLMRLQYRMHRLFTEDLPTQELNAQDGIDARY